MSVIKFSQWQDLDGNEVANSSYPPGLVLVKSQTIGSGVSSVTVTDAFSSAFNNYKIVVDVTSFSAAAVFYFSFTGSSSLYNYGGSNVQFGGTTGNVSNYNYNYWYVGAGSAQGSMVEIELTNPFAAVRTAYTGSFVYMRAQTNGYSGTFGGFYDGTTSFTGFTLVPGSGTLTGGAIRVYGYNNG